MTNETSSRLNPALYIAAFLLFALRFLWLGDTVYILDEPYQQLRIDEHFAAGTIPLSNSRGSSIPLPYGPGALWIFMIFRLVSWHPVWIAFCHLFLQTLGSILFVRTVQRAYGMEAGAWCALLAACSPLLFFFSRHPWDPCLLMPLSALLLWQLQNLKEDDGGLLAYAALGLTVGYGLNIHLMFGPAAIAAGLTLLYLNFSRHGIRTGAFWQNMLIFGGVAVLVLAPYAWEATQIARAEAPLEHARNKEHWGDGRNLWWIFLRTTLYSSLFGSDVQLQNLRAEFAQFTGSFWAYFFRVDLFGWFGKLAAWLGPIALVVKLLARYPEKDLLRIFAACAFFLTLLVYQYLNIPTDPHYFNPIWWFVFLGIATAITGLHGIWKKFFLGTLALSMVVNFAYICFALAYIHQNRGARNMATSVVVSEQLRALRAICESAHQENLAEAKIYKEAVLSDPPFDFLPRHMPECKGLKISLTGAKAEAHFLLTQPKSSTTSAELIVERANQMPPADGQALPPAHGQGLPPASSSLPEPAVEQN